MLAEPGLRPLGIRGAAVDRCRPQVRAGAGASAKP